MIEFLKSLIHLTKASRTRPGTSRTWRWTSGCADRRGPRPSSRWPSSESSTMRRAGRCARRGDRRRRISSYSLPFPCKLGSGRTVGSCTTRPTRVSHPWGIGCTGFRLPRRGSAGRTRNRGGSYRPRRLPRCPR